MTDVTPKMLKATAVAARLGISKRKVYYMIENRDLPSVEIGGALRVPEADLENYINQNRRQSDASTS